MTTRTGMFRNSIQVQARQWASALLALTSIILSAPLVAAAEFTVTAELGQYKFSQPEEDRSIDAGAEYGSTMLWRKRPNVSPFLRISYVPMVVRTAWTNGAEDLTRFGIIAGLEFHGENPKFQPLFRVALCYVRFSTDAFSGPDYDKSGPGVALQAGLRILISREWEITPLIGSEHLNTNIAWSTADIGYSAGLAVGRRF